MRKIWVFVSNNNNSGKYWIQRFNRNEHGNWEARLDWDLSRNKLTWMLYKMSKHHSPPMTLRSYLVILLVQFAWKSVRGNLFMEIWLWASRLPLASLDYQLDLVVSSSRILKRSLSVQQAPSTSAGSGSSIWYRKIKQNWILKLMFDNNILTSYLEGRFGDISDTDNIHAARCYLRSVSNSPGPLVISN